MVEDIHSKQERNAQAPDNYQLPGAVFLDRDGTINQDDGYINHPRDFELYPTAAEAVKILNDSGLLVFVVTNQSGIARGYYTFDELDKIHEKLKQQLAEKGAKVDKIYISPYHQEGHLTPYNILHKDRKPNIGMFNKARKEFSFDPHKSFMIGDRYSDIGFGNRAGLKTFLVLTGNGKDEFLNNRGSWQYQPDFIVKDLLAAAKFIRKEFTP